jgi:hypothetical protein
MNQKHSLYEAPQARTEQHGDDDKEDRAVGASAIIRIQPERGAKGYTGGVQPSIWCQGSPALRSGMRSRGGHDWSPPKTNTRFLSASNDASGVLRTAPRTLGTLGYHGAEHGVTSCWVISTYSSRSPRRTQPPFSVNGRLQLVLARPESQIQCPASSLAPRSTKPNLT